MNLRLLNCYDVEDITEDLFSKCIPTVFSEPQSDTVYASLEEISQSQTQAQTQEKTQTPATIFAVEALPGQFDQRADSASECIQLISQKSRPLVKNTRIYYLEGQLTPKDIQDIKNYVINPVESREADLKNPRPSKLTIQNLNP